MLTYILEKTGEKPLYLQLYDAVRLDILEGRIAGGEKLPSKRALSEHLGVSKITVEAAYEQLLAEGYITSKERSGFFASYVEQMEAPLADDGSIDLGFGGAAKLPAGRPGDAPELADAATAGISGSEEKTAGTGSLFPFSVWARLMRSVILDNPRTILERVPAGGHPVLKSAIAGEIYRERGMRVSPGQIIIGAGNEYFYSLLVQFLGRDRVFAIENPLHRKIDRIYALSGAGLAVIPMDDQGMTAEGLRRSGASVAHITPSHHYPTGIVMPITRRREILKWLSEEEDRYLVEDEYDSEFSSAGRPVPSIQSLDNTGRVIFMNSFSKTISPALRISYMVLPQPLLGAWQDKMGSYSCAVPSFDQLTLAKFISEGYYERHLRRMKKHCRVLRQEFMSALKPYEDRGLIELRQSDSGLHFLLGICPGKSLSGSAAHEKTDDPLYGLPLKQRLKECGLDLPMLSGFYVENAPGDSGRFFVIQYPEIPLDRLISGLDRFFSQTAS